MSKYFFWFIICIVLAIVLLFVFGKEYMLRSASKKLVSLQDRSVINVEIGDTSFSVELVNSPESIVQGLSGRDSIGNDGMLFAFPTESPVTFWMRDMLFDIDIVWLSQTEVLGVVASAPHPEPFTSLEKLPLYSSTTAVGMVLELPAGTAKKQGIQAGSPVVIKY